MLAGLAAGLIAPPAGSQPIPAQPAISRPAISQPAISQPAISQPAISQPAVAPEAGALAAAPEPGAAGLGSALETQVRQLTLEAMQAAGAIAGTVSANTTVAAPGDAPAVPRFEISIGQLDARLRLAPCERVEPYLPENVRLWGKARIGLRCTQGASKWNVYLPITVKAFGPALVAVGGVAAGSVLAAGDLALAEVDLAEDASVALSNRMFAVGRVLARPLKAGQSLRQSHLKLRQWFAAGDTVNVVAQGAGFSVAGDAQALTNGIEGQPARVRTESGRVLTGLPVGDRRMELSL